MHLAWPPQPSPPTVESSSRSTLPFKPKQSSRQGAGRMDGRGHLTFLHVGEALLQLVVHLGTKGKVIHKDDTARQGSGECACTQGHMAQSPGPPQGPPDPHSRAQARGSAPAGHRGAAAARTSCWQCAPSTLLRENRLFPAARHKTNSFAPARPSWAMRERGMPGLRGWGMEDIRS